MTEYTDYFKEWTTAVNTVNEVYHKYFNENYEKSNESRYMYFICKNENKDKKLSEWETQVLEDPALFLATRIYQDNDVFAIRVANYIKAMEENHPPKKETTCS